MNTKKFWNSAALLAILPLSAFLPSQEAKADAASDLTGKIQTAWRHNTVKVQQTNKTGTPEWQALKREYPKLIQKTVDRLWNYTSYAAKPSMNDPANPFRQGDIQNYVKQTLQKTVKASPAPIVTPAPTTAPEATPTAKPKPKIKPVVRHKAKVVHELVKKKRLKPFFWISTDHSSDNNINLKSLQKNNDWQAADFTLLNNLHSLGYDVPMPSMAELAQPKFTREYKMIGNNVLLKTTNISGSSATIYVEKNRVSIVETSKNPSEDEIIQALTRMLELTKTKGNSATLNFNPDHPSAALYAPYKARAVEIAKGLGLDVTNEAELLSHTTQKRNDVAFKPRTAAQPAIAPKPIAAPKPMAAPKLVILPKAEPTAAPTPIPTAKPKPVLPRKVNVIAPLVAPKIKQSVVAQPPQASPAAARYLPAAFKTMGFSFYHQGKHSETRTANTMQAFQGPGSFEMDIQAAADGTPIICHNRTAEEVSGGLSKDVIATSSTETLLNVPLKNNARFTTLGNFLEKTSPRPCAFEAKDSNVIKLGQSWAAFASSNPASAKRFGDKRTALAMAREFKNHPHWNGKELFISLNPGTIMVFQDFAKQLKLAPVPCAYLVGVEAATMKKEAQGFLNSATDMVDPELKGMITPELKGEVKGVVGDLLAGFKKKHPLVSAAVPKHPFTDTAALLNQNIDLPLIRGKFDRTGYSDTLIAAQTGAAPRDRATARSTKTVLLWTYKQSNIKQAEADSKRLGTYAMVDTGTQTGNQAIMTP